MAGRTSTKPVEIDRRGHSYGTAAFLVVGILLVIGTILWARSDTGMIDVTATIANSEAERSSEAGVDDNAPSVPNAPKEYASLPNGGLQAQSGDVPPPPPPPPEQPETASTTASTTEDGTDTNPEGGEESGTTGDTDTRESTETNTDTPDTSADTTPGTGEEAGSDGGV